MGDVQNLNAPANGRVGEDDVAKVLTASSERMQRSLIRIFVVFLAFLLVCLVGGQILITRSFTLDPMTDVTIEGRNSQLSSGTLITNRMKTELRIAWMNYQFGNNMLIHIALRRLAAFLVGTTVILIGAITIVGVVSRTPVTLKVKFREAISGSLATSSPGIVLVIVGAIIVITSISIGSDVSVPMPELAAFQIGESAVGDQSADDGSAVDSSAGTEQIETMPREESVE